MKGISHHARARRRPGRDWARGLTLLAAVTPAVAQLVLLAAMAAERRWMFVLMIVPGLAGCLASLLAMIARGRAAPPPEHRQAADPGHRTADDFAALPELSMTAVLGLDEDPLMWRTIAFRWLSEPSTRVPVGTCPGGIATLDIVAQGPHALVAGTTGSGKSVLLQNWCLALAARNPPQRLHFVLLDFKGGSAFNPLRGLPHTVGAVDDLDTAHALRAIIALERELKRRERLAAQANAASIATMQEPLPLLVIVIDEFHALRQQLPDAIERLTHIASLGRSLGMHVIACTQHPMGQVHADMKSNMALNLCLRVRDGLQSTELIGNPAAASISPALPGALYCYDGEDVTPIRCCAPVQGTALVDAVTLAGRFLGASAEPLFTPPLPTRITTENYAGDGRQIPFAVADDGVRFHDVTPLPATGGIVIIGGKGRGKSTALRMLAELWRRRPRTLVTVSRRHGETYASASLAPPIPHPPSAADAQHGRTAMHTAWLVDDADALFDPFCGDPLAERMNLTARRNNTTVVVALEQAQHLRRPELFRTRLIFPTGDRATDLMSGIPSELLNRFGHEELTTPGRGVLLEPGRATILQCVLPGTTFTKPAFFHGETS